MRAPSRWTVAAPLLLALSCSYSPSFQNDKLQCGVNGSCPKGYGCASDNRCWKTGDLNGGSDGGTGADSARDTGGADPLLKFVGSWTFKSGTSDATCTDGSVNHRSFADPPPDFITVVVGGPGVLAQYYCDSGWKLRLTAAQTMAVADTGQTCRKSTTVAGVTTTYDWSALAFTFGTIDGQAATATGHVSGSFSDSNGVTGTCDVMFNGQLAH
jgi:hypothetical protein